MSAAQVGNSSPSDPIAAVQWAPSGNAMNGIPGEIMRFLATPKERRSVTDMAMDGP